MNEREREIVETVKLCTYPTLAAGVDVPGGKVIVDEWNCCVMGTRIAIDVLKEHYIKAVPMKMQTVVFSEGAWAAEQRGEDPSTGGLVWGCGITGGGRETHAREGFLNGHCVAIVENEVLLDTTSVQFTVLSSGVLVEPLAIDLTLTDVSRDWLANPRESFLAAELEGCAIAYKQHPDLDGLYDAPDWKQTDQRAGYEALRKGVSAAVRARLS